MTDLSTQSYTHSLYIIGNGFDLSHGMKTSWRDFIDWLSGQRKYELLNSWLTYYPGFTADLWSNLEKTLGNYDLEEQYEYCTHDIEIDYDHMMRSGFIIEDSPISELSPVTSLLQSALAEWILSIDLPAQRKTILPEEARYLSFNYTSVLEKTYGIPTSRVLHIHGCADYDDLLVFGHDKYVDDFSDPSQVAFIENAKASIIGIMNDLYKDVPAIIEANVNYFASLADIEDIVTLGHSYNDIDRPYFKAISAYVKPGCLWTLSYHGDEDKRHSERLMATLGIDSSRCQFIQI